MNKKGELTSSQIVILVLAIIGFGIVLVALFLLNLGGYSAEETCHLSVLARATAPSSVQGAVPLKCVTKKICLSDSASSGCTEQFAGETVEYVKLTGSSQDKINKIEEESANAMYDCWSMMGEGKLDIFGAFYKDVGIDPAQTTCVICSRVAVDNNFVKNNEEIMKSIDINNYLKTKQVPGSSLTYLQTFTDRGVSSYASVKSNFNIDQYNADISKGVSSELSGDWKRVEGEKEGLSGNSNNQIAFIFMQIKSKSVEEVLKNQLTVGGTAVAIGYATPVGKIVGLGKEIIGWLPGGRAVVRIVEAGAAVAVIGYGIYNAKQGQLAAFNSCETFETNDEKSKEGCSIVQGLDYNFRDINTLCASIQGEL